MALMKFREPNQVKWQGVRPAHNGTQVLDRASATNGTTTIYTVPAGNVFYLCYVSLGYYAMAAGTVQIVIRDSTAALRAMLYSDLLTGGFDGIGKASNFWPPVELDALWTVKISSSAPGLSVHGTVFGWVE